MTETAAYPELRLVVVMQGDRMSYAETFEEAPARAERRKRRTVAAALFERPLRSSAYVAIRPRAR